MNYEKKYKDALERARQFSEHPLQEDSSNIVEYIFPELQESKDERIRKEIIETFKILGDGKIPVDINYADIFTWLEKQGGQKFAWSEEDEEMLKMVIKLCEQCGNEYAYYWLNSLKERILPKQEWSEEDEEHIKSLLERLEGMCKKDATFIRTKFAISEDEDWLKYLSPQSRWKPSDEQMEALHDLNLTGNISYAGQGQVLIELYNDLKKLAG